MKTIVEQRVRADITEGGHLDPSEVERRRADLQEARSCLVDRDVAAETVEAQAGAGPVILQTAEDADLVIVGNRGLNPFRRLLLGSDPSRASGTVRRARRARSRLIHRTRQ